MQERYHTHEWNYGQSPSFNMQNSRRFPEEKVETPLMVERGVNKGL